MNIVQPCTQPGPVSRLDQVLQPHVDKAALATLAVVTLSQDPVGVSIATALGVGAELGGARVSHKIPKFMLSIVEKVTQVWGEKNVRIVLIFSAVALATLGPLSFIYAITILTSALTVSQYTGGVDKNKGM